MRRFRFDRATGHPVDAYGSRGVVARGVQHTPARLVVTSLWLEPEAQIGIHDAVVDQLFLVVEGAGWALDAAGRRTPVAAGEALFWHAGESHGVGSDGGLAALVLEGEGLDPEAHLVPVEHAAP
ncbi:MAG: cupin [Gemmatimonadota bacterium]